MSSEPECHELEKVTIKFAGDSGDGMQLTGSMFSDESAVFGNDLATFPDYPAEIRAPAGTVAGVSGFQVQIGSVDVHTPGDTADALVAMNPAAFKANIRHIRKGATIVIDMDAWTEDELQKAEMEEDPLKTDLVSSYRIIQAPISAMTRETLKETTLDLKGKDRCKNMFALGIMFWLFNRPLQNTEKYLKKKFEKKPDIIDANVKVLRAGYTYAQTIELFSVNYKIRPAKIKKGVYRQISGNQAVALGIVAASQKADRDAFLGSYPITPASDILHELAKYKEFGVKVIQAEDEIGGICMAIGAAYAGDLAFTTTSGPGLSLKAEAIGLAVIAELPLVIVNVQRGGPSTGLPTKTEQSDLLQAMYGRHGECPLPVIAASTPGNCFEYTLKAAKIAVEYMTPVILLTDGYLGNGSEPWLIPDMDKYPPIESRVPKINKKPYMPYKRDQQTLAREWCVPGMPDLAHRIGGLEKDDRSGHVSYVPQNHEFMVRIRAEKVERVVELVPDQKLIGNKTGDLLVISWGGTFGSLLTAVTEMQAEGNKVSLAHINYLNPFPENLKKIINNFKQVVVCELNLGQLHCILQSQFHNTNFLKYNKIQGQPFMIGELKWHFASLLAGDDL
ncbi:MAG: 2-oxoacid:acceptor oxidoreductase subunit alpha [bacterium]|nr:2-oxoacid:acceptor oxidoreductase subunit alpha [bacterium]MBU1919020.1 2-oxoacid:acceptor oxidoreductase subunit alpha [bacterium]